MSNKDTKTKIDCPIGDTKLQYFVLIANFVSFLIISSIIYFALELKFKQILPLSLGALGLVLALSGIILSLVYTIFNYKKPQGGFGLFWLLGAILIVFGTLITFMQKVG